jgi:hypothetical protein
METVQTHTKLQVVVHYMAAEHPFKEDAAPNETVGQLKKKVLVAFGLTEGQAADGNIVTYTLYHDKKPLDDLSQTLGELAGHHHVLQLKLGQQITQG